MSLAHSTNLTSFTDSLRCFHEAISSDCQLLQSKLQAPPKKDAKKDLAYLNELLQNLTQLEGDVIQFDRVVRGPEESRLTQVTVEELLYCASSLFTANAEAMRVLKEHRENGGRPNATSEQKNAALNRSYGDFQKENTINLAPSIFSPDPYTSKRAPQQQQHYYREDEMAMNVSLASDLKDESMMIADTDAGDGGYNADDSHASGVPQEGNDSDAEDVRAFEDGNDDDDDAPVPRAPTSILDDDDMPKTPTLDDWKLSHMTRNIIDQRSRPNHVVVKTAKTPQVESYSSHRQAAEEAVTNDATVNQSISEQFGGSPIKTDVNISSPIVVKSPTKSSRAIEYSTPIEYSGRPFEMNRYNSSPDTPTLGTPTKTCSIMATSAAVNTALVSPSHQKKSATTDAAEKTCAAEEAVNVSVNSDDGLNDPLVASSSLLRSPPKAVKVLNPRRAVPLAADGKSSAGSASDGWIPLVSEEEWSKAPSFLKLQFGLPAMNKMLTLLNQFLAETMKSSSKHLESFSYEEIVRIVGTAIEPSPIKVVVLGLVHLKRLDVGTENSIKVYKIRRFYH